VAAGCGLPLGLLLVAAGVGWGEIDEAEASAAGAAVKASWLDNVEWFAGSPPRRQRKGSSYWHVEEPNAKMQVAILLNVANLFGREDPVPGML
jgi:hypothetical protein